MIGYDYKSDIGRFTIIVAFVGWLGHIISGYSDFHGFLGIIGDSSFGVVFSIMLTLIVEISVRWLAYYSVVFAIKAILCESSSRPSYFFISLFCVTVCLGATAVSVGISNLGYVSALVASGTDKQAVTVLGWLVTGLVLLTPFSVFATTATDNALIYRIEDELHPPVRKTNWQQTGKQQTKRGNENGKAKKRDQEYRGNY